jgi:hypothetical protein
MQPTHFRAYAAQTALSRRLIAGEKLNLEHDVHNPVVEGELKDGVAAFTSKAEIAYVAFYAGDAGDDQVCLGRVDGPFGPGKVEVSSADVPQDGPVDLGNGEFEISGNIYRKAD